MNPLLNLLLSRHRRFKAQTYFANRFPTILAFSVLFALFDAQSLNSFIMVMVIFLAIDMLLSFAAWLYYKTDL